MILFPEAPIEANKVTPMLRDHFVIENLSDSAAPAVAELLRRNLSDYDEAGNVLASTFRRIEKISQEYAQKGSQYFIARDLEKDGQCIGGAGLGTLHGLPASEGLGEIRDLVVEKSYRGRGLGKRLLQRCLEMAIECNYKRIYLETTPEMKNAQKLFRRFGFRPVTQATKTSSENQTISTALPCYFLLEDLSQIKEG